MEPTKALTTRFVLLDSVCSFTNDSFRNLFAIDYLKDHPDTTQAEFKVIYDGLAADIKKVHYLFQLQLL